MYPNLSLAYLNTTPFSLTFSPSANTLYPAVHCDTAVREPVRPAVLSFSPFSLLELVSILERYIIGQHKNKHFWTRISKPWGVLKKNNPNFKNSTPCYRHLAYLFSMMYIQENITPNASKISAHCLLCFPEYKFLRINRLKFYGVGC